MQAVDFGLTLADILPDERRGERNRTYQITLNKSSSLTSREKEGSEPRSEHPAAAAVDCTGHRSFHKALHIRLLMDY